MDAIINWVIATKMAPLLNKTGEGWKTLVGILGYALIAGVRLAVSHYGVEYPSLVSTTNSVTPGLEAALLALTGVGFIHKLTRTDTSVATPTVLPLAALQPQGVQK